MPDDAIAFLDPTEPWILLFAHPGHELRAHHLMERVRPSVAVLTDGALPGAPSGSISGRSVRAGPLRSFRWKLPVR